MIFFSCYLMITWTACSLLAAIFWDTQCFLQREGKLWMTFQKNWHEGNCRVKGLLSLHAVSHFVTLWRTAESLVDKRNLAGIRIQMSCVEIEHYTSTPPGHVNLIKTNVLSSILRQWVFFLPWYRNAGDEWLVTSDDTEFYIPEVSEVKSIAFSYTYRYCIYTITCFKVN